MDGWIPRQSGPWQLPLLWLTTFWVLGFTVGRTSVCLCLPILSIPDCSFALCVQCVYECVTAVLFYQAPVWWPGVEAIVEFLSDGISQPPSTQRPARPQALTFTTNGPPHSTETPEWQSHLSLWRAEGEKSEIKSDGEYLNGTTLFFFVCLWPLTTQTDTHVHIYSRGSTHNSEAKLELRRRKGA